MKTAKEGLVALRLPDNRKEVFYNPEMELSRDISVAFLQSIGSENFVVCDLLSAAGARAIRYAKETNAKKVFANDASEAAVKYIKQNASANKVEDKVIASCSGANTFLESHIKAFDFIDIDPFGSPIYFLEELAKAVKAGSYLAVTATDCGALAGIFPKTCMERYGVKLERTECFKEVGIRNLIGVVASHIQKHKLFVRPLLSHVTEHYFRVFLKVDDRGKNFLDSFYHCNKCDYCAFGRVLKCKFCRSIVSELGPVWAGSLYDKGLCFRILDKLKQPYFKKSMEARKILLAVVGELEEPFYYNIHKISEQFSKNTPSMKFIINELEKSGFQATRTQFDNTAIKTDAKIDNITKIIQILNK